MKQVIIIHGLPSKEEYYHSHWPSQSNSHWIPWVQRELLRKNMLCQTLEMPHPYDPVYQEHTAVLDQMSISDETVLVGHSCGGGFLLRYLSEHPEYKPRKVVLVAPWLDLEGYLRTINSESNYFDFTLDPEISSRMIIDLVYSQDDDEPMLATVDELHRILTSSMREHVFTDKGHFTEPDLGTKEFPELVDIILK